MTITANNLATLTNMLKACVEQIKEYSPNEHVIGTEHQFSIVELEAFLAGCAPVSMSAIKQATNTAELDKAVKAELKSLNLLEQYGGMCYEEAAHQLRDIGNFALADFFDNASCVYDDMVFRDGE